jgi:UDP-GlcNAc:undecaprenyl-phosphate GlcNAc-1-phosphate transferase
MLGLLMSASTMVIGGRTPPTSGVTFFFFAPLLIPVFILGVPLADATWAFVRRTLSGQGFQTADKMHVHHRLMRLGHGHRRTVIILWSWTAILCGFVLLPIFDTRANVFIPLGVAVLVIALFTWFSPLRGRLQRRRVSPSPLHERARR